jgi:hypothetical protein
MGLQGEIFAEGKNFALLPQNIGINEIPCL